MKGVHRPRFHHKNTSTLKGKELTMPIKTFSKENRLQEPQNTELKGTTIENGLGIQEF